MFWICLILLGFTVTTTIKSMYRAVFGQYQVGPVINNHYYYDQRQYITMVDTMIEDIEEEIRQETGSKRSIEAIERLGV